MKLPASGTIDVTATNSNHSNYNNYLKQPPTFTICQVLNLRLKGFGISFLSGVCSKTPSEVI